MSGLRKTQVVLLTLMGAGTIAYFMPTCHSTTTTATTRGSGGTVVHRTGFWPMFWGGWGNSGNQTNSPTNSAVNADANRPGASKSTVTRGGFGSSSGSVHS